MSDIDIEKVRWEIVEMVKNLTPNELKNYYLFKKNGIGELYCTSCGRKFMGDELYCLACERRRGPYFHLFYDLNHERFTPLSDDPDEFFGKIHMEGVIYGVSNEYGALVVYTKVDERGQTLRLSPEGNYSENTAFANVVIKQYVLDEVLGVAVFPHLPPGTYTLEMQNKLYPHTQITVFPGHVAEVDWR